MNTVSSFILFLRFRCVAIFGLLFCVFSCFVFAGDVQKKTSEKSAVVGEGQKAKPESKVSFTRDIRPILSDRCFLCHGPAEDTRKADLRLDIREDATRDRDGEFVIKPGDAAASTILDRLTTKDADLLMPPPDSHRAALTSEEVDKVKRWIAEGANWSTHWAFTNPKRSSIPKLSGNPLVYNPIDSFVIAKLQKEGLKPSPQTDKVTLLRRLSLDLIGLPPSIKEVDAFLADKSSDAYEKQVERLLSSPHYGERWGRVWLDAARYADSNGFEKDLVRNVWFYRDWVINALNKDMPYDQFVIEQIAGDLLPNATQAQKVATGFLRNSMVNEEGGIDPEQFRMEAMFDRMDAIGKAVLGFTMQCAQCHSHKYDPMNHEDYYQMFAFLNNCHESQLPVYTPKQEEQRMAVIKGIRKKEKQLRKATPNWREQMHAWEATVRNNQPKWKTLTLTNAGDNAQRYILQPNGSFLAQGYSPNGNLRAVFTSPCDVKKVRSFRVEVFANPNLPSGGPGRGPKGGMVLSEFIVEVASKKTPTKFKKVKFKRVTADYFNPKKQLPPKPAMVTTGDIQFAIDGNNKTGWGIDEGPGRRNQSRKAVFVANKDISYPEGAIFKIQLHQNDRISRDNKSPAAKIGCFRISVTSKKTDADPLPAKVRKIISKPSDKRTAKDDFKVFSYWRKTVPAWKQANDEIESLWKNHPEGSTQLVVKERKRTRLTYRLDRGDFLKPEEKVTPDVPSFLHAWPEGVPKNRLNFAKWLVDRKSPTTARAMVNRVWQVYFGIGLVSTAEDFGSQGELPTHPDLIDWLAMELMDNGWSLKHLHRQIVLSATYRQSSKITKAMHANDPENRLLARGPRFRTDAEVVRDIYLTASGLLNPAIGGPSVHPPSPAFLYTRPVSFSFKVWNPDKGADRYRRAIYTFQYRSMPYPSLQVFDAPSGEFSTVRRTRSNTPLQALTTLNEPLFLECAQALARKVLLEKGDNKQKRIEYAFRRCTSRKPTKQEAAVLLELLESQIAHFQKDKTASTEIQKDEFGEKRKENADFNAVQLASWTVICRVILNLDETITKE